VYFIRHILILFF